MKYFIIIFITLLLTNSLTTLASEDFNWQRVSENNYINPEGIIGTTDIYGFSFILKSYIS